MALKRIQVHFSEEGFPVRTALVAARTPPAHKRAVNTLRAWESDWTRTSSYGCVERVQRTLLQECWRPAFARDLIPKVNGLRLDLDRYLNYYNSDRAHTGRLTKGRTPEEIIGKEKMWPRRK